MNRGGFVFLFRFAIRSVDPNSLWKWLWLWHAMNESLRCLLPGLLECLLPSRKDFFRSPVVQRCRCHHSDAAVIMFVVVPVEKSTTESQRVFVAAKTLREIGTVFHRFELAFRERIVVGDMRSTVRLRHAQ